MLQGSEFKTFFYNFSRNMEKLYFSEGWYIFVFMRVKYGLHLVWVKFSTALWSFMQGSDVNLVKSPIDFFRLLRKMTPNLCNPNLGVFVCTCVCVCVCEGVGGSFTPCWFFLNNLEMVKSCNLGVSQHSVKFYQKNSYQTWYP